VAGSGAGFLDSHLCDELLARSRRALWADNLDTGSLVNTGHIRAPDFVHSRLI
jgi:UDP-glucose 4-epimerase